MASVTILSIKHFFTCDILRKPAKLRVKRGDETAAFGARLFTPAIDWSVFPVVVFVLFISSWAHDYLNKDYTLELFQPSTFLSSLNG